MTNEIISKIENEYNAIVTKANESLGEKTDGYFCFEHLNFYRSLGKTTVGTCYGVTEKFIELFKSESVVNENLFLACGFMTNLIEEASRKSITFHLEELNEFYEISYDENTGEWKLDISTPFGRIRQKTNSIFSAIEFSHENHIKLRNIAKGE